MQVNREKVQSFFDGLAPGWDAGRETDGALLREIMGYAGVGPGCEVLDVACGTGVLFPYYLERGAAHVTGIDLSPEMIRVAAEKYRDPRLTLMAGDIEQADLGTYDCIVVLNALPHFPDPARLIAVLTAHLAPGGRLTVAHDRPREAINGHHRQTASEVSRGLPPATELAALAGNFIAVDTVIDDGRKYVVSGTGKSSM